MGSSDFTPHVENIGNVLGRNDNWFDIPRYQRDYAWDKRNIKTFYDDIVSRIGANNTNLSITPYFLGTILRRASRFLSAKSVVVPHRG